MGRLKLFIALGTRPEAIKLAPVILAARKQVDVDVVVCNTGQHRSMARDMLRAFGIEAEINLDIMRPEQNLTDITIAILQSIEEPLRKSRPDWVVVQGDTTTSFSVALAAFYQRIPVAHVEAGLRTGDRYAPWPEEINRRLNSVLATRHFAPTVQNAANLAAEGIPSDQMDITGNTGIDALIHASDILDRNRPMADRLREDLVRAGAVCLTNADSGGKLVLITAHRRENFGSGIEAICRAIVRAATMFPNLSFVFPVHPNPAVTGPVDRIIRAAGCTNVFLIDPVDYFSFVLLMKQACLIVTDSGGIQEEAATLGKRLVVMREVTERVEIVGNPGVWIVGADEDRIVRAIDAALRSDLTPKAAQASTYGDGSAALRILQKLRTEA